jgi:tetratricopeptide (TPR) repeat protein
MDAEGTGPYTRTGAVLGTPSYMAPEQAGAEKARLGPSVDIYALGAILYEALTDRPPFLGDSDVDTLLQVRTLDPISPRRLRPTMPRDLETICLKCLHKEPRRRYASAGDLADDLRRFLRKEPIRARPVGVLGRTWRWCRRRPAVAGLLAALVVVMLGSVIGLAALWLLAEERAKLAEQRQAESDESLRRGRRAIDRYFTTVSEEELLNVDGMQPLREKLLREAVNSYQEFLDQHQDNPRLQEEVAIARRYLARIKSHQGRSADSEADLRKAIERLQVLVRDHPGDAGYVVELAHAHESLGTVLSKMSQTKEALESYRETWRLLETLGPADARERRARSLLAVAHRGIGIVQLGQGETGDGLRALQQALQMYAAICRDQPDDETWLGLALTQQFLGSALINQERLDEAEKLLKDALAIHQRFSEAKHVHSEVKQQLARTLHRLGVLEFHRKNWNEALVHLERALTMNRQLARANPQVRNHQIAFLECLHAVGSVHLEAQRPMEAYGYLWQGAEVLRSTVDESPDDPYLRAQLGQHLFNLGLTLTKLSRPAEALRTFEEGVQHGKVALEAAPQSASRRQALARHYYHISRIHRLAGRHAESAAAVRERARLFPDDPQELSEVCILMAHCVPLVGGGKNLLSTEEESQRRQYADEAMDYLRRAIARGCKDIKRLREDRGFDPLRSRGDFQQLLVDLEKKPPIPEP